MASYVVVPKTLSIEEIENKGFALSPSLFKRVEIKNQNVKKIKDLLDRELKPKDKGFEVGSKSYIYNSKYFFIRTKALQPTFFLPNYDKESIVPILPQSFKNYNLKEGDVLISKDSNIGEVVILDKDLLNYMPSGGIYRLPVSKWKYYLLAFMKNDFFKTQLNFLASRGATIRHAKTLFLDCLIPFPNQQNSDEVINYVELLTKAIINKEKEIRRKHKLILEKIEKELLENQKPNEFEYKLPNIEEIESKMRIDAGYYSNGYLEKQFYIRNYKFGAKKIFDWGFNVKRGQNLQVSAIGKSFYTNVKKPNFYTLIRPTNFSEEGTISKFEYLGNPNNLSTLEKGDIVFSGEGTIGKCVLFPNINEKWITNIHGIILKKENHNVIESAFISSFIRFLRNLGVFDYISVGGQGGSLAMKYWDDIYIPNFPESKQKEIAELYYNPIEYPTNLNLDTFLEEDSKWNEEAGILQLDSSAKKLKERLNEVIHQIVMDEEVEIDFEAVK
jgi:hypothetical protein